MIRSVAAILVLLLPSLALAASTNFDELIHGSEFFLGESIESNGLTFEVLDIADNSNGVAAIDGDLLDPGSTFNRAGGTDIFLSFRRTGLNFPLPSGTQHVSFLYGVYTSHAGTIIVNGVTANPAGTFLDINGTTLGGVLLTAEPSAFASNLGKLTLTGPINSLVVGGVEFALDEVTISVPEPSSATLLLFAFLCGASRPRRSRI